MADGLNQARAMRISEIVADYRNIQTYISAIRINASAEEYTEEGFALLRTYMAEAQAMLSHPFQTQSPSRSDVEFEKTQLQRIIIDASVRRFKAQRIYLKAAACLRWVNSRTQILQGQRPHAGHVPALQHIRTTLRTEIASVTDARVELSLRHADSGAGRWLQEDPGLPILQQLANNGGGK